MDFLVEDNVFSPQLMRTHMNQPLWDHMCGQQQKWSFLVLYIFMYPQGMKRYCEKWPNACLIIYFQTDILIRSTKDTVTDSRGCIIADKCNAKTIYHTGD